MTPLPAAASAPIAAKPLFAPSEAALAPCARALQLLKHCSRAMTRIHKEKELLAEVCRVAVAVGGYQLAWAGTTSVEDKRIKPRAFAGHEGGYLSSFQANWAELPLGTPGALAESLRRGHAMDCPNLKAEPQGAGQAQALQLGLGSLLALPLIQGATVLGVLALYRDEPAAASAEEISLLQDVADNLAFALNAIASQRARDRLEGKVGRAVVGLSGKAGLPFLQYLLGNLAESVECRGAYLTRLVPEAPGRARLLAGVELGQAVASLEFEVADTPCQKLLSQPSFFECGPLPQLYPRAQLLAGLHEPTYVGHRLEDSQGQLLGMLFVVFAALPSQLDLLRSAVGMFASRAAAELERMDADQEIRRLNACLEERVQQRTAQLKLANEELESFCYSASHDLRTPLSAVDGFAHLLEQGLDRSADPVAERHRHYLRRIRAGMVQMGELIEALLQLARLARTPMTLEPVDLSQMADDILTAYREREPARELEVEVEPGLSALGDARLLRQLMDNLLGNAWKFSGGKAVTRIRFAQAASRDLAPDEPVFVVEDQGAGFNMAYAQNLFGPFQRLHSPSEFEGTGIGLATVQRIVQRHGGRVWGEAEPGKGARFYFSLGPAEALAQAKAQPS